MSLDVESVLTGLRNARREAIMSWTDGNQEADEARHLLNAILDLELAICALEDSRESEHAAEPSDVRASSQLGDDPVALARAMQQKRHGGGA